MPGKQIPYPKIANKSPQAIRAVLHGRRKTPEPTDSSEDSSDEIDPEIIEESKRCFDYEDKIRKLEETNMLLENTIHDLNDKLQNAKANRTKNQTAILHALEGFEKMKENAELYQHQLDISNCQIDEVKNQLCAAKDLFDEGWQIIRRDIKIQKATLQYVHVQDELLRLKNEQMELQNQRNDIINNNREFAEALSDFENRPDEYIQSMDDQVNELKERFKGIFHQQQDNQE